MASINDIQIALTNFWGQFTHNPNAPRPLPVFRESRVPNVNGQPHPMPYLTYELTRGSWQSTYLTEINIWTRSNDITNNGTANHILTQIADAIPEGVGTMIKVGNGFMWLKRATNFSQEITDPDDRAIIRYLVTVEVLSVLQ